VNSFTREFVCWIVLHRKIFIGSRKLCDKLGQVIIEGPRHSASRHSTTCIDCSQVPNIGPRLAVRMFGEFGSTAVGPTLSDIGPRCAVGPRVGFLPQQKVFLPGQWKKPVKTTVKTGKNWQ